MLRRPRPARHRRLDDALADLPLDDPMLLTELDGFLTGVFLCPQAIPSDEWLQSVWGLDEGGVPPFDDPADVQWFADAVTARYAEIVREIGRGKPQPIFDIDERNGDVLWELWIDGFAEAMALRPASWEALAGGGDRDAAEAVARIDLLTAVAFNESDLDSQEINALADAAPAEIVALVLRFHAARLRTGAVPVAPSQEERSAKVGRNDPCSCGSGKKFKRCCG